VLRPGDEPDPATFSHLNMLVMVGGRQRSADDFGRLYAAAGFALIRIIPTGAGYGIIEGAPAWRAPSHGAGAGRAGTSRTVIAEQSVRTAVMRAMRAARPSWNVSTTYDQDRCGQATTQERPRPPVARP
jgi:hypothetical protein